jgi:hypothetical protein
MAYGRGGGGDMHGVAEASGPGAVGSAGGMGAGGSVGAVGASPAAVDAAGGMEQGGALAAAIANALAAGGFNQDVWDPGYAEAQDVAVTEGTINQPGMVTGNMYATTPDFAAEMMAQEQAQAQAQAAQAQAQQPAADVSYGAGYPAPVYGPDPTIGVADAGAPPAFGATTDAWMGQTQGATPDLYMSQSQGAAPDMWMGQPQGAAPDMWMGQPQGMISQVDNQGVVMPGAITAGTGPGPTEGTINQPAHQGFTRFKAPGELSADYQAGTPTGPKSFSSPTQPEGALTADKANQIEVEVNKSPEWHTQQNRKNSQERLNHRKTLNEKAKTDPNGWYVGSDGKEIVGVTNAQVAAAYAGFDSTLEAYAVINGTGSLGQLLGMAIPFANALPMAKGFLVNNGLYDTSTGAQIADTIAQAIASGEPLGGGIGGPSNLAESGAIDQATRDFVTQYPWAKGLDPRYIQYLIANPAEVESLLSGAKELYDVRIPV